MTDQRDPIIVIVDGRAVIYDIPVGAGLHMHFPGGATVSHERPAGAFDVDIGTRAETIDSAQEALRRAMRDALANGASPKMRPLDALDEILAEVGKVASEARERRDDDRSASFYAICADLSRIAADHRSYVEMPLRAAPKKPEVGRA